MAQNYTDATAHNPGENMLSSPQLMHSQFVPLTINSGFDFEFVEKLDCKYECSVCLLALRNPIQTFCGHRFCRDCILSCMNGCNKECPIDKQPLNENSLFHDSCIEREILQLKVKCSNSSLGCKSQVDLRYIEDHIHACGYQPVLCPNECSVTVLHKELEDHLSNKCLFRLSKCKFCSKTFFYNSEQVHLTECPLVTVHCELCGKEMPRANILEHKKESCLNAEINCSFSDHGCQYKSSRSEMTEHNKDAVENHLQLLSASYKKINTFVLDLYRNVGQVASGTFTRQPSLRSQLSQSSITEGHTSPSQSESTLEGSLLLGAVGGQNFSFNNNLYNMCPLDEKQEWGSGNATPTPQNSAFMKRSFNDSPDDLKAEKNNTQNNTQLSSSNQHHLLRNLSDKCVDTDQRIVEEMIRVDNLIRKIDFIGQNLRTLAFEMNGKFCNGTFVWKISDFSEILKDMEKNSKIFYSAPFYTSQFGYKFCLRSNILTSNGETFFSLYTHIMQSENDDFLTWPFQGSISLILLDCREGHPKHHFVEVMDVSASYDAFKRPKTLRSVKGYGFKEFISVSQILKPVPGCEYVKNNTLYIKAVVEAKK